MRPAASRSNATTSSTAESGQAYSRFRIQSGWLKLGMYVADLDRPWLDTPFFLQGFLITSVLEIETLQKYCQHVVVELERTRPEMQIAVMERGERVAAEVADGSEADPTEGDSIRPALSKPAPSIDTRARRTPASAASASRLGPNDRTGAAAAALDTAGDATLGSEHRGGLPESATGRASTARSAANSRSWSAGARRNASTPGTSGSAEARKKLRRAAIGPAHSRTENVARSSLLGAIWEAIRGLFARTDSESAERPGAARLPSELRREIVSTLPTGETLRDWPDRWPVEKELPRAKQVLERGEKVLAAVFADIQAGQIPQIEQVEDVMGHVVSSMIDNPDALLWVAHMRERHAQSYRHAMRVALYMVALGRQLGFPKEQLSQLGTLGLLADIGKTRVPQALLDKPGMLSPAEFEIVKEHVGLGLELLERAGGLSDEVRAGIAQHHERVDGSGYPGGLRGDAISIFGRMAAIVDSYTAMTAERPYAQPAPPHAAMMSLFEFSGRSFHEPLVEQFVQAVGIFPVGSLVELSNGEVAVVLEHNRARRLEPRVLLLTDSAKNRIPVPTQCDLLEQGTTEKNRRVRILRGLAPGSHGLDQRDYYADSMAETVQIV